MQKKKRIRILRVSLDMQGLRTFNPRLILRKGIAKFILNIPGTPIEVCAPDNIDLLYITNSKIASSTIKATLFALKLDRYINQGGQDMAAFKKKYEKATSRSIGIDELKNKITFSVVRNPYSRILAGYLDKSRGQDTTFKKQFGNKLPNNFLEFLNRLKDLDPWNIDTHFRPQYLNLAIEDLKYNYIFFFEKFNRLEEFLKSDKGLSLVNSRSHSTNASNMINEYFNEESTALVQKMFENDFRYFGYSIDPNISESKFKNFLSYDHENEIHSDCKDGILNRNTTIAQSFKLKKYTIYKELIAKKYI